MEALAAVYLSQTVTQTQLIHVFHLYTGCIDALSCTWQLCIIQNYIFANSRLFTLKDFLVWEGWEYMQLYADFSVAHLLWHDASIYLNKYFHLRGTIKGSLTVRGVGMFMSLFERNYKV